MSGPEDWPGWQQDIARSLGQDIIGVGDLVYWVDYEDEGPVVGRVADIEELPGKPWRYTVCDYYAPLNGRLVAYRCGGPDTHLKGLWPDQDADLHQIAADKWGFGQPEPMIPDNVVRVDFNKKVKL